MIREGRVFFEMEIPDVVSSEMGVFYNPHMRENRDLSLLLILSLPIEELTVCDPMAASGVRLLRMLTEVSKVKKVVYNDLNPKAAEFFKSLVYSHGIDAQRVEIFQEDACLLLRKLRGVDYVDIDPFGSPVPFLESSILAVKRGGILAVTATDTSVLSGTYPSTCLRRYGSRPLLSSEFYHEVGLRILIKKVIEEGAKLDYSLRPVFSYSYRHYFRAFFVKDSGPRRADQLVSQIGFLVYCPSCLYRNVARLEDMDRMCPHCGQTLLIAGPLWLGKLWDEEVLTKMWQLRGAVELSRKSLWILERVKQEAEVQTPGFYTVSAIARSFRLGQPPPLERFLEVFQAVRTHFSGEGFRSPLPHTEVIRRVNELLQRA